MFRKWLNILKIVCLPLENNTNVRYIRTGKAIGKMHS